MKKELLQTIHDINKKYKTNLVNVGTEIIYTEKIPFSSPRANYAVYGGVPLGKATELFGAEGGGKTTTALDIVANAQKYAEREFEQHIEAIQASIAKTTNAKQIATLEQELKDVEEAGARRVLYIDAENTLDEAWAALIGVDLDSLILVRPQDQTAEQVLQILIDVVDSGGVILAVLDSVPMLVSQSLYEENLEKKTYAGVSAVLTEFCRKISPRLSKHKTALVMINQVREDLNNPYNQFKTTGGMALKHLYALRIFCRKGSFIDESGAEIPNKSETPVGNMVDLSIVKTKVCRQDRKVSQYTLHYTTGIDVLADTLYLAIKYGIIEQAGAWFKINAEEVGADVETELKFQGRPKLLEFLRTQPLMFEVIKNRIESMISE